MLLDGVPVRVNLEIEELPINPNCYCCCFFWTVEIIIHQIIHSAIHSLIKHLTGNEWTNQPHWYVNIFHHHRWKHEQHIHITKRWAVWSLKCFPSVKRPNQVDTGDNIRNKQDLKFLSSDYYELILGIMELNKFFIWTAKSLCRWYFSAGPIDHKLVLDLGLMIFMPGCLDGKLSRRRSTSDSSEWKRVKHNKKQLQQTQF